MGGCIFISGLAIASGLLTLLSGFAWIARLVIGASTWIKYGAWPEYYAFEFLYEISVRPPQTELLGIQKTINWVLSQSFTGTAFTAALLFYCMTFWLGILAGSCLGEQRRLKEREEERRSRPADPPDLSFEDLVKGWDKKDDPLGLGSPRKPRG